MNRDASADVRWRFSLKSLLFAVALCSLLFALIHQIVRNREIEAEANKIRQQNIRLLDDLRRQKSDTAIAVLTLRGAALASDLSVIIDDKWHGTARDFAYLRDIPLSGIIFDHSAVDDSDLQYISGMPALEEVSLNDTQVTDACIKYILTLPLLRILHIKNTKISAAGRDRLEAAFPTLTTFEHD